MANDSLTIQMRLQGAREAAAQAAAVAGGIKELGNAAGGAGRQMEAASHSTFLWNQGLYTLRRGT